MMTVEQITEQFRLEGDLVSFRPFGAGHINRTWRLKTSQGKRYVLQRINRTVFTDVPGLMENVTAVTRYLSERTNDPRECLHLIETKDGRTWYQAPNREYYRIYDYIGDAICLQHAEHPSDFYESAVAFGRFQKLLGDFPAETLHETIPDFHHTPKRYLKFRQVVQDDPCGRVKEVGEEIDFLLAREAEAGILQSKRESGELPLRVTHNDTKLNNVMLDQKTRKALCVIDLDTVMPGLAAYDFGDGIRFGASTAAEDEKDLSRVNLDLKLYACFAEGFIKACENLSKEEIEALPFGAKLMTLENGLRFLTDYLEGDHYYHIEYADQNLDRCRTQLKLVRDTEEKWDEIRKLVAGFE
ncbi:MAG: aminoglycoside phosphotransferase family protein [Lachnospiraceae bacterium]|nr:aminoglycoside phosphotransferase family protein [Lachnospiraceae bacterium]